VVVFAKGVPVIQVVPLKDTNDVPIVTKQAKTRKKGGGRQKSEEKQQDDGLLQVLKLGGDVVRNKRQLTNLGLLKTGRHTLHIMVTSMFTSHSQNVSMISKMWDLLIVCLIRIIIFETVE